MPRYRVTLPISGHAIVEVEAADAQAAIEAAGDIVETKDIEQWSIHYGCRGNVCSFPNPWEPEVEEQP